MTNKANNDVDLNTLKHDINKLSSDVAKLARMLAEYGEEKTHDLKESAIDVGKNSIDKIEKKLKKNPMLTVSSAFGVGLLVGLISHHFTKKQKD